MEEGVSSQKIGLSFEPRALLAQGVGKRVEGGETTIGNGGIGERPKAFGRLKFRRIGRKFDGFDAWWMSLLCRDMEPAAIFDHQHLMIWASVNTLGEGRHHRLIGRLVQSGHEPEPAFAGFWTDKGVDVQPFVPRVNGTAKRLPCGCPDALSNWFEADAVFIHRPERNTRVEKLRAAELLH